METLASTADRHNDPGTPSRFMRIRDGQHELQCSKAFCFKLLKAGRLVAKRLDGLVLVERESFERYIDQATPYRPQEAAGGSDA